MMRASLRSIALLGVFSLAAACGSSSGNLFDSTGGGGSPTGGRASEGGAPLGLGGAAEEGGGGARVTGGASGAAGNISATGGAGGKPTTSSGGRAQGGAQANTGGDATFGGAGAGGGSADGGALTSGGADGGGAPSTGGVSASGGAPNVGPVVQTGALSTPQFNGFACHQVTFPVPFKAAAEKLRVLLSVLHPGSNVTHDPVAAWAQNISATGFDACITEDGGFGGEHPAARIDWVALAEPDAGAWNFWSGRQPLPDGAGANCSYLSLGRDAIVTYQVKASVQSSKPDQNRGTAVWVENLQGGDFRLCAQRLESTKGPLSTNAVDWVLYTPDALGHGFAAGELDFTMSWREGTSCKKVPTNCKGCQNAQVAVNHRRRNEEDQSFLHGATLVWAEDFNEMGELTVCVREISAENGSHDTHLSVDWLVREQND